MKRPGGGAIAAGIAGLAVAAAGVWGQLRALDEPPREEPGVLAAVLTATDEDRWRLVVLDSRRPGEETVLVSESRDRVFAANPTWSPDGKSLAWIEIDTDPDDDEEAELVPLAELTGDIVIWNREQNTRSTGTVRLIGIGRLEWSPDSRLIAGLGEPFQLWNRAGELLALREEDDPGRRSGGGGPLHAWSPDGQDLVYLFEGKLLHYDRTARLIDLRSLPDYGLPASKTGYVAAAWRAAGKFVVAAVDERSIETFEVDVARRTSTETSVAIEDFYAEFLITDPLSDALGGETSRPDFVTRTADGRGMAAALMERISVPTEGPVDARLLVERSGIIHEFAFRTLPPPRGISVVLVGNWPAGVSP